MPTKQEKETFTEMLHIPVTKTFKREMVRIAEADARTPADMGRVLWREAIEARKDKEALATSGK